MRADRKNSLLFIALAQKLAEQHPQAKRIHLVLDNFKIHDSAATRAALSALDGRVVLHFLPPYSPDGNKIERLWLDLQANDAEPPLRRHAATDEQRVQLPSQSQPAHATRRQESGVKR